MRRKFAGQVMHATTAARINQEMEDRLVHMGETLDAFISASMSRLPLEQLTYITPIREALETLSLIALAPLFAMPLPKDKADLRQRILQSQESFEQLLQQNGLNNEAQRQFFSSIHQQVSRRVEYAIAFGTDPVLGGQVLH